MLYLIKEKEINKIIKAFRNKKSIDNFSVALTYDEIKEKNYSLSAGQYFDVKIEYIELTQEEFQSQMNKFNTELETLFEEGSQLQSEILKQLKKVKYE